MTTTPATLHASWCAEHQNFPDQSDPAGWCTRTWPVAAGQVTLTTGATPDGHPTIALDLTDADTLEVGEVDELVHALVTAVTLARTTPRSPR